MNVLVCDDDQQIVDSIIEELKKKSEETHVSSRFYGFSQPSQIDLSLPYDIALLDIDMGETNGIRCSMKMGGSSSPLIYRSLRFRDKRSPFRYIIVEITAQLVYSFFQESSFNEDCRNERFCNAINTKVRVDGIA